MKREAVILKRLGPIPFWRGQDKCLDSLRRIYDHAMEEAHHRLVKTDVAPAKQKTAKASRVC